MATYIGVFPDFDITTLFKPISEFITKNFTNPVWALFLLAIGLGIWTDRMMENKSWLKVVFFTFVWFYFLRYVMVI